MVPEVSILWVDSALLAVNKPAGLLAIPDGYHLELPHVKTVLEPEYGPLWIVHRLDKDTSGVMLLARSAEAHRSLNTQFEQHSLEKVYHAIVAGSPAWDAYTVRLPLRANVGRRKRTAVDHRQGKPAVTHLHVLERFPHCTLLECRPETGRMHQIRAHLYALGYPLLGDPLYGSGAPAPGLERVALHAWSLTFTHPASSERMTLHAPYPPDLDAVFSSLRRQER